VTARQEQPDSHWRQRGVRRRARDGRVRGSHFTGFLLAGAPKYLILASQAPMWAVLAVLAVGDHDLLGQIVWAAGRADECDQSQQQGEREQVHGVEQGTAPAMVALARSVAQETVRGPGRSTGGPVNALTTT